MALRVIDHYPDINATGVYRNIHIKAQFNKGITPNTLEYSHFSVHDANTYSTVPGTLGVEYDVSGVANIIVIEPTVNMVANTKYIAYVFGRPNSVVSTDDEQVETTYSWEFTTGTELLEGQMPAGIPSGSLPGSGIPGSGTVVSGVYVPTTSGITQMMVISTDPQNQEPNVPSGTVPVAVEFNLQIDSPLSSLSGWVTIEGEDVLV